MHARRPEGVGWHAGQRAEHSQGAARRHRACATIAMTRPRSRHGAKQVVRVTGTPCALVWRSHPQRQKPRRKARWPRTVSDTGEQLATNEARQRGLNGTYISQGSRKQGRVTPRQSRSSDQDKPSTTAVAQRENPRLLTASRPSPWTSCRSWCCQWWCCPRWCRHWWSLWRQCCRHRRPCRCP